MPQVAPLRQLDHWSGDWAVYCWATFSYSSLISSKAARSSMLPFTLCSQARRTAPQRLEAVLNLSKTSQYLSEWMTSHAMSSACWNYRWWLPSPHVPIALLRTHRRASGHQRDSSSRQPPKKCHPNTGVHNVSIASMSKTVARS